MGRVHFPRQLHVLLLLLHDVSQQTLQLLVLVIPRRKYLKTSSHHLHKYICSTSVLQTHLNIGVRAQHQVSRFLRNTFHSRQILRRTTLRYDKTSMLMLRLAHHQDASRMAYNKMVCVSLVKAVLYFKHQVPTTV